MTKKQGSLGQMKKFLNKIKGLFKKDGPPELPPEDFNDEDQEEVIEEAAEEGESFEEVSLAANSGEEVVEEIELGDSSEAATPPSLLSEIDDDKDGIDLEPPPFEVEGLPEVPLSSSSNKTKEIDLSKLGFTPLPEGALDDVSDEEAEIDDAPTSPKVPFQFPKKSDDLKASWNQAISDASASISSIGENLKGLPLYFQKSRNWVKKNWPNKERLNSKKVAPKEIWSDFKIFSQRVWQNLHWDELVANFLSPEERPKINRVFSILLICACSYLIGKTAGLLLTPKSNSLALHMPDRNDHFIITPSPQDILAIKTANLFNAQIDGQDLGGKKKDTNSSCQMAQIQSNLPLKLLNTIVLQDSVKSVASVQVRGNSESMEVREGDKVESLASIGKIERLKMIFRNLQTGECEFVQNDELKNSMNGSLEGILDPQSGKKLIQNSKMQGIRSVGNNFFIQKSIRDDLLKDIGSVLTQARAIQITNPDGSLAFKMTEVVPGSIYSHLNIVENDMITQINGNKISSVNDLMNMFSKIKQVDRWQMTIERDGSEQVMEYRFE